MNLEYLREKKELLLSSRFGTYFKRETLSTVLLVVSALLGIMVLVKVRGFFAATARAEALVNEAVANGKSDPNEMEKHMAKYKAAADELKKTNLFAPPPPKQHPVKGVSGILGGEVLINDKWYKVGDSVGDAKIVAIEPTQVRIEWDGNEKVFLPIDAAGPAVPRGPRGPRPGGTDTAVAKGEEGEPAPMVQVQLNVRGGEGMGRFGGFSPEDRAGMRERFENMSEEEREAFRAQMRERFGGRGQRGGGFGGPGGERGSGRRRR